MQNITLDIIIIYSSHLLLAQNASGCYAEIDGAKKQIQDKLANLSRFDDDLVERALKHAQELDGLAYELNR